MRHRLNNKEINWWAIYHKIKARAGHTNKRQSHITIVLAPFLMYARRHGHWIVFQNASQTSCIRRRSCSSQEGETTSGNHHISWCGAVLGQSASGGSIFHDTASSSHSRPSTGQGCDKRRLDSLSCSPVYHHKADWSCHTTCQRGPRLSITGNNTCNTQSQFVSASISITADVPAKLKAKIWADEFVQLDELLLEQGGKKHDALIRPRRLDGHQPGTKTEQKRTHVDFAVVTGMEPLCRGVDRAAAHPGSKASSTHAADNEARTKKGKLALLRSRVQETHRERGSKLGVDTSGAVPTSDDPRCVQSTIQPSFLHIS